LKKVTVLYGKSNQGGNSGKIVNQMNETLFV